MSQVPLCNMCRHYHFSDQPHGTGVEYRHDNGKMIHILCDCHGMHLCPDKRKEKVKIKPEEDKGYMCRGCNKTIIQCTCTTPAEWQVSPERREEVAKELAQAIFNRMEDDLRKLRNFFFNF